MAKTKMPRTEIETNVCGEKIVIEKSNKVIKLIEAFHAQGYVGYIEDPKDKSVFCISKVIRISTVYNTLPEHIITLLSGESIHLALFSLGFIKENQQFDNMGLHTWKTTESYFRETDGIAVEQFGLRRDG